MAFQEKQLGQARENSTDPVSVYSPAASVTAIISTIKICNNTGVARTFSLFLDDDGTTYDESTALYFNSPLTPNQILTVNDFMAMNNPDGNLAYSVSLANAVTISVFGAEIS